MLQHGRSPGSAGVSQILTRKTVGVGEGRAGLGGMATKKPDLNALLNFINYHPSVRTKTRIFWHLISLVIGNLIIVLLALPIRDLTPVQLCSAVSYPRGCALSLAAAVSLPALCASRAASTRLLV